MTLIQNYLQLTKPTIMLLVLFTGATALFLEGSALAQPGHFALVLLGLFLTGGSANALNQYFERDVDAKMERTRTRRPLPLKNISEKHALIFSVTIGFLGVALFYVFFNPLAATIAAATILFYSLFYTLYLKPTTEQNIVIGGIAGSMGPIIAWIAMTNTLALVPIVLFLIIFFWTPPHFWALALYCKDDYVKAKLPMMPVVKGEQKTIRQMVGYSVILILTSLVLMFSNMGWFYLASALILGAVFLKKCLAVQKNPTIQTEKRLFFYSIIYLFALFLSMIIDQLIMA